MRTDVSDSDLWVDDELQGGLATAEDTVIMLPPGAYRFEARSGGSVAASATVTLRPGVPADVALMMPSGAAGAGTGLTTDAGRADAGPRDAGAPRRDAGSVVPAPPPTIDAGERPRRRRSDGGTRPPTLPVVPPPPAPATPPAAPPGP